MDKEYNPSEERELLMELYRFTASNGKIYNIKPATVREIMSPESEFSKALDAIGVPALISNGNPRLYCLTALKDENHRKLLSNVINQYVTLDGEPVTLEMLENDGFTVDDMLLTIKRLTGISG